MKKDTTKEPAASLGFDINKLPFMPLFVRDLLSSPRFSMMSPSQRGVYMTLLAQSWIDEGLPDDLDELAMLALCPPDEFAKLWVPPLSSAFKVGQDGLLRNARQEYHRQEAVNGRDKKSYAAHKRWNAVHKQRTESAYASQCNTDPDPDIKPAVSASADNGGASAPSASPRPKRQNRKSNLEAAIKEAEAPAWMHQPLADYLEARKGGKLGVWAVGRWVKEIKAILTLGEVEGVTACERACDKPWAKVVYPDRNGTNTQHAGIQAASRGGYARRLTNQEVARHNAALTAKFCEARNDNPHTTPELYGFGWEIGYGYMASLDPPGEYKGFVPPAPAPEQIQEHTYTPIDEIPF